MREVLACLLDYWRTHRKYRGAYEAFMRSEAARWLPPQH